MSDLQSIVDAATLAMDGAIDRRYDDQHPRGARVRYVLRLVLHHATTKQLRDIANDTELREVVVTLADSFALAHAEDLLVTAEALLSTDG